MTANAKRDCQDIVKHELIEQAAKQNNGACEDWNIRSHYSIQSQPKPLQCD